MALPELVQQLNSCVAEVPASTGRVNGQAGLFDVSSWTIAAAVASLMYAR